MKKKSSQSERLIEKIQMFCAYKDYEVHPSDNWGEGHGDEAQQEQHFAQQAAEAGWNSDQMERERRYTQILK